MKNKKFWKIYFILQVTFTVIGFSTFLVEFFRDAVFYLSTFGYRGIYSVFTSLLLTIGVYNYRAKNNRIQNVNIWRGVIIFLVIEFMIPIHFIEENIFFTNVLIVLSMLFWMPAYYIVIKQAFPKLFIKQN